MLKLNHLTGFGSGAAAAAGGDVTSYVFDGTGDYLSIPDHADWDLTSDYTIECYVNMPDATPADEMILFCQFVDNSNEHTWKIDNNGAVWIRNEDSGSVTISVGTANGQFTDNTWHHVAIVRNNDNYFIFVDGTDQVNSGSPDSDNPATLAGSAFIGSKEGSTLFFAGYIDEYRISNTARYTTGFTPTSTQFVSDANTLLLIHGGEAIASGTTGSGATFVDSGNTGHTVTENGNARRETEQEFKFADDGVGYFLDGDASYLSIPDHANWDLAGDFTWEAFIYMPDVSRASPTTDPYFFSQYVDNSNHRYLKMETANGNIQYISAGTSINVQSGNGALNIAHNNEWLHLALVRENDTYFMWLNGVDVASTGTSDASTPSTIAGSMYIGDRGAGDRELVAYLDEIRISDVARYTSEFSGSIPSAQFTSDANTLLLIHGGETKSGTTGSGATFTDSGDTGHTVTENGNAIESTGNFYKF